MPSPRTKSPKIGGIFEGLQKAHLGLRTGIKLTGSHAKLKRTAGIVSRDSVRAMINSTRATVSALPSFTPADAPKP
jgi:hypothetical protein